MKTTISVLFILSYLVTTVSIAAERPSMQVIHSGALAGERYRVIVSTDIGGSDPDDYQSMVHLMLYTNVLDFEGLISTQWRGSRKAEILKIIDCYERDYPNLKTHSDQYPTPDALRAITKVGAIGHPGPSGFRTPTEGSQWIVQCARRDDPRPLYILIWGGITDLAQALHDAPDILPKLRVYFIGGPNKQGSINAYNYIEQNFPTLWIIENNVTYRGWFNGGDQDGEWGNREFVTRHVAGHGALGAFFAPLHGGSLKMGDTPSLAWLLHGNPADPTQPSWGGRFVRIWDGRKTIIDHLPTSKNELVEVFGVNEFTIPVPEGFSATNTAALVLDTNKKIIGVNEGNVLLFRFAVRDVKVFTCKIQSDFPGLDGMTGTFSSVVPPIERRNKPSTIHPNWWGDDFDPAVMEGSYPGAKTISRWRVDFLQDFAKRMDWCKTPASTKSDEKPPVHRVADVSAVVSPESHLNSESRIIPAFPGAEGYGAKATGGRGGRVIAVTNLNDSGPGSLRAAVREKGPRTIVFRVSGTIPLKNRITIRNDDITIAGQTAPGDGICLKGSLLVDASNVIVRYIRCRQDTVLHPESDAIGGRYHHDIIFDHISASWSGDETMSLYHNKDVTIQWCLIAESCAKFINGNDTGHQFGGIWGNNHGTYHHNLIADNASRNPRWASGCGYNDYRNNVLYNWKYQSSYGGEAVQRGQEDRFNFSTINMVANYYKAGPATDKKARRRIVEPSARSSDDRGRWYVADNYVDGYPEVSADNWKGVDGQNYIKMNAPWPAMQIRQQTPQEAYKAVLAQVGCSKPARDSLDATIIQDVATGTATYGDNGILTRPTDTGGWPKLKSAPAPKDSDGDGMPDSWETGHGLDPHNPADRNSIGNDGYTHLEQYLNGLAQ